LMVQPVEFEVTVVAELAELSAGRNSFVVLVTLAELVMTEPSAALALTVNANVNTAVVFAPSVAIEQLIVPVAFPEGGVVQLKTGPEFCASDTKVVPAGTELVSTTACASSGPRLVTSTL